jgi:hypothetical protein
MSQCIIQDDEKLHYVHYERLKEPQITHLRHIFPREKCTHFNSWIEQIKIEQKNIYAYEHSFTKELYPHIHAINNLSVEIQCGHEYINENNLHKKGNALENVIMDIIINIDGQDFKFTGRDIDMILHNMGLHNITSMQEDCVQIPLQYIIMQNRNLFMCNMKKYRY